MSHAHRSIESFLDYLYPTLYEAMEPYAFQAQGVFDLVGIREYVESHFPLSREEREIRAFSERLAKLLNEAVYHAFLEKKPEKSYYLLPNFRAFEMEFSSMITVILERDSEKLAEEA